MILEEKAKGKTVILTTHNMYDATELCDRVAFIVDGAIRALDAPKRLIMSRGAGKLVYTYQEKGVEKQAETRLTQTASDTQLLRLLQENRIASIHSTEPTLNDIFLELTGRKLQ